MDQQQPSSDSHPKQKIDLDHSSIEGQGGIAGSNLNQIQNKIQGSGNRVFNFVFNLFGQHNSSSQPENQNNQNRQNLLAGMWRVWIKEILETELYQELPLIEPDLEEQLDWVDFPGSVVWETPNQSQQTYSGEELINIFNQLGVGGKLLILGESGAGKTTALLKLTKKLIIDHTQRDIKQPIPVLLNLSRWEWNKLPIAEWLIEEISHSYNINKKIIKAWLKNNNLLLLLDGLDEVSEEYQRLCVNYLEQFIGLHRQTGIIICCRTQDYEYLSHQLGFKKIKDLSSLLRFQSAVKINLLTEIQIYQCLGSGGAELAGTKKLLQENKTLRELGTTPLMLSIIIRAFKGDSEPQLSKTNSNEELYNYLFNRYLDRMFERRQKSKRWQNLNKAFPRDKTEKCLAWLAQKMQQENQKIFFIERMQPSLLEPGCQKQMYHFGIFLLSALIAWLILFIPALIVQQQSNLIGEGILEGILIGLLRVSKEKIEPVETLESAWKNISSGLKSKLRQQLKVCLVILLISWLITCLIFLITGQIKTDINGLAVVSIALAIMLILAVLSLLIYNVLTLGLEKTSISDELRKFPNQGIKHTVKNSFKFAGVGAGIFSLICFAIAAPIGRPWNGIVTGIMLGLCVGIYPFSVYIQHLVLRLVLSFRDKFNTDSISIPLRLVHFLNYAEERIFVKKVGGGYEFIDDLLQAHFTQKVKNLKNN